MNVDSPAHGKRHEWDTSRPQRTNPNPHSQPFLNIRGKTTHQPPGPSVLLCDSVVKRNFKTFTTEGHRELTQTRNSEEHGVG